MRIFSTREFDAWLLGLNEKSRVQVDDRLDRIADHRHFGDCKPLGGDLFELRWKNGRRIYFAKVETQEGKTALMLLGGDKHGQENDIRKARRILERGAR